jgi:predicted nucleic acid-binding Zn ribbon protein
MNCPGCGTPVEAGQQFCRSCGTALTDEMRPGLRPQILTLICVLLTFVGIVVGIAGGMAELRWLKNTGVLLAITGMFSIVAGNLILQMRGPQRLTRRHDPEPPNFERADTTNKLLPLGQNDYIPSVVENTTDLLQPVEQKQRPTE